jgi:hypothetical protein
VAARPLSPLPSRREFSYIPPFPEEVAMFDPYCPRHASRVLLTVGRVRAVRNAPDGIHVELECWCGERLHVLTGRNAEPAAAAAAA